MVFTNADTANAPSSGSVIIKPDEASTCSIARYAFDAYSDLTPPATGGSYVTGTSGRATVTFLDENFVKQAFNGNKGGLLEITLSDASISKAWTKAELAIQLCSLNNAAEAAGGADSGAGGSGSGGSTPTVINRGAWGGAVAVSLPSSQPVQLGVLDKASDVLHLALYNSSTSAACVVAIPLSGVPVTTGPPAKEVVPLTTTTTTAATVTLSWRLIPFDQCKPQQFVGAVQAPQSVSREDAQSAQLREIDALIDILAKGKHFAGKTLAVAEMHRLAHEQQAQAQAQQAAQKQQAQQSPDEWVALAQAAGGPDLTPLAVINCADKGLQLWMHHDAGTGSVVVAFRGTMERSIPNWLTDLTILLVPPVDLNPVSAPAPAAAAAATAAAATPAAAAAAAGGDIKPAGAALNLTAASDDSAAAAAATAAAAAAGGGEAPAGAAVPAVDPAAAAKEAMLNAQVLVHKGFLEAYMEMRNPIISILNVLGYLGSDNGTSTSSNVTQKVVFTGHSLGGAMATLAAYDMAARKMDGFYGGDVQLYSWGSPRVGNKAFIDALNGMLPADHSLRFTNTLDIVPKVLEMAPREGGILPLTYYHIGAHWDLETPIDPALRFGLDADSPPQRPVVDWDPKAVVAGIKAHLGTAYYAGMCGFFDLDPATAATARDVSLASKVTSMAKRLFPWALGPVAAGLLAGVLALRTRA